jgi:hypothetical protein
MDLFVCDYSPQKWTAETTNLIDHFSLPYKSDWKKAGFAPSSLRRWILFLDN